MQRLDELRRATAAHRHLFDDGRTGWKVRDGLPGGVTQPARVLLGHDERHSEQCGAPDQEGARANDGRPAIEYRSVSLLQVDENEDGAIAIEKAGMPHAVFLAKALPAAQRRLYSLEAAR